MCGVLALHEEQCEELVGGRSGTFFIPLALVYVDYM